MEKRRNNITDEGRARIRAATSRSWAERNIRDPEADRARASADLRGRWRTARENAELLELYRTVLTGIDPGLQEALEADYRDSQQSIA